MTNSRIGHQPTAAAAGAKHEAGTKKRQVEPGRPDAAHFRLPDLRACYGISRSEAYRRLAAGDFIARKCGRVLLIDGDSVRAYVARLPAATFRQPKAA